jgi:ABC-type glycerol-3-phosphate transport system substrate-binding protein
MPERVVGAVACVRGSVRCGVVCHSSSMPLSQKFATFLVFLVVASHGGAADDAVVLRYWHAFGGVIGEVHEKLVVEFNDAHPGIRVDASYGGTLWTMRDRLTAAIASGAAPDVASIDQFWIAEFAGAGATVPVDGWASIGDAGDIVQGWLPGLLDIGTYDGVLHAIPMAVSSLVMYVNVDLLRAVGLRLADVPRRWDHMLRFVDDLPSTLGGRPLWTLGLPTTAQTGVVYPFIVTLWQHGGDVFAEGTGTVAFADDAGVRSLELWLALVEAGVVDPHAPANAWESGSQLFILASSAHLLTSFADVPFEIAVAPMPYADVRVTGAGGRSIAVFADGERERAAASVFVAWLASTDVNARWSLETGYQPLRRASLGSLAFQELVDREPNVQAIVGEAMYGRIRPNHWAYGDVSRILGEAIEHAIYRGGDPATILSAAAAEAERTMERRAAHR